MNNLARIVVTGFLAVVALPSNAQMIEDWMFTSSGRLRGHMLPPLMLYDDAQRFNVYGGDAESLAGSFAAVAATKNPVSGVATRTLATAGWYERAPSSMLSSGRPEAMLDMISPIASGGGVTGFGPRLSSISPIPEPSAYAMLLAGLTAIGFIARRRGR